MILTLCYFWHFHSSFRNKMFRFCDILQEQYLWERFGSLRQLLASAIAALFIQNIVAKIAEKSFIQNIVAKWLNNIQLTINPGHEKNWIMSRMTMIKSTLFQGFSEAQKNNYVPLSSGNLNLHATYQEILDWQTEEEVSSGFLRKHKRGGS